MNIFPGRNFDSLNSITTKRSNVIKKNEDNELKFKSIQNNSNRIVNRSIDFGNLERLSKK